MNKAEIAAFIERMEEVGDSWDEADVERVYGDRALEDALEDRLGDLDTFSGIIGMIMNRE